ncbi:MAG: enoyl-CoA hydratase-related protein, partial [Hyphomonadaceae bacterium]
NAIASHQDCADLVAAFRRAEDDRNINVAILTGAGAAFCAGGDLKAMKERQGIGPLATPADTRQNYKRGVHAIARALADLEIATIAAVNGPAIGLGLDLAALCDLRLISEKARVASSFVKVGIVPGDGGAWVLQKAMGYSRAAEMTLTGDQYSAAEVVEMGLFNRAVAPEKLMEEARALAGRIACNPPRAVRMTKRLLREAQHARYADILELSAAYQAIAHETADNLEAIDAFIEKRPPRFTGE